MKPRSLLAPVILALLLASCGDREPLIEKESILLDGTWQFALDSARQGIAQKWYSLDLPEVVSLPGTLDENNKGYPNLNRTETMRLSRELMYEGYAWYRKEITIPAHWKGRQVTLFMERTKPTQVWIDTIPAGSCTDIMTPQEYDLSRLLVPGSHFITILVNNGRGSVPDGITGSHAWTEHTQSNWNGIIGKFCLESANPLHISGLKIFPDLEKKTVEVEVNVTAEKDTSLKGEITLKAESWNTDDRHRLPLRKYPVTIKKGENHFVFTYKMNNFRSWSEFNPVLYRLIATLKTGGDSDSRAEDFGMRKLSAAGTQFAINGTTTFLRGKHDACVFPLTGHPPMDVESWRKVFRIAKSYNINFYRFHSWTPPEAAFKAADIEGIYLQPELPFWGSFRRDRNTGLNEFLMKEGDNIIDYYGNHASFALFALGNELRGDIGVMKEFVDRYRQADNRRMYSFGTNNYLGFRGETAGEDFYAACRVGADTDTTFSTHIRGSFSFADAFEGGYINSRYPSTNLNYAGAISKCTLPVLGTEVGQYQIYPDFGQIEKYTGVMKPWNLEVFRERLKQKKMYGQAMEFFRASGALSVICYKADIEMALRTPGFGGFHLLDLQDFPGQGTALIGILDAFMDSKGLITPEEFGQFCNKVVPLAIFEKYCWENSETFKGKIQVANYSGTTLKNQKIRCEITDGQGTVVGRSDFKTTIAEGGLAEAGSINVDLSAVAKAEMLTLSIVLDGTPYRNTYQLWIYPETGDIRVPEGVTVSGALDDETISALQNGGTVLLFPSHDNVMNISVGGLYIPDYWNYRMFRGISESNRKPVSPGTMSILTDPRHPLFRNFPTEFHSNWQWWPIVRKSRPLILDNTDSTYIPLVQVVDNMERNHKLGLVFEFAVGEGKLLVCMSDLRSVQDKPEAKQFYASLLEYASSPDFRPAFKTTPGELKKLFSGSVASGGLTGVANISYN